MTAARTPISAGQFDTLLSDIAWLAKRTGGRDPGCPSGVTLTVSEVERVMQMQRFATAIKSRGLAPGVAAATADAMQAQAALDARNDAARELRSRLANVDAASSAFDAVLNGLVRSGVDPAFVRGARAGR